MEQKTINIIAGILIIGIILVLGYFIFKGENQQNNNCTENWQCSAFGTCVNGVQTRTCVDSNNCGTNLNKPSEQQSCTTSTECNAANVGIRKCISATKYEVCLASGQWSGLLSCQNACTGQGVCS